MNAAKGPPGRRDAVMDDLLRLQDLPALANDPELERLQQLRHLPLEGEEQIFWAIQQEEQPETRQVLPQWLSTPISLQLLRWRNEANLWADKIAKRPNQTLAPAMQKKYEEWKSATAQKRLLFRLSKQLLVAHIPDHAELKKIRKDLVLVTLIPDLNPQKLKVVVGDGHSRQLVVLRAEACEAQSLPDILTEGLSVDSIQDMADEEEARNALMDDKGADLEALAEEADFDHEEAMIELDCEQHADQVNMAEEIDMDDPMEILAVTDDEAEISKSAPASTRVKSFMHRESYKTLAKHGLADLPTTLPGICIGCHATSQQWQGFFPEVHSGLSFSWGGKTRRSELEALVKVMIGMLTAYVERFPREQIWKLVFIYIYIIYIYI